MQNEIRARMNNHDWSREMAQGVVSQKRRQSRRRMLTISTLSSFSVVAMAAFVYSFAFSSQSPILNQGVVTVKKEPRNFPAVRGNTIMPVQYRGLNFGESRDVRLIDAALRWR